MAKIQEPFETAFRFGNQFRQIAALIGAAILIRREDGGLLGQKAMNRATRGLLWMHVNLDTFADDIPPVLDAEDISYRVRDAVECLGHDVRGLLQKNEGFFSEDEEQLLAGWARESLDLARHLEHAVRACRGTHTSQRLPLTDPERAVLEILAQLPPTDGLTGKELLTQLPGQGVHGVTQSVLTTRVIAGLRNADWDLFNRRGSGYYLSQRDRERLLAASARH